MSNRFGSSLANLGRLDSDRFEDFAVGSPFEGPNREGAVYVYRGSQSFSFKGSTFLMIVAAFLLFIIHVVGGDRGGNKGI